LAKTANMSERSNTLESFAISPALFLQNAEKCALHRSGIGLSRHPTRD